MKRREALTGLGVSLFGSAALPSWAIGWKPTKLQSDSLNLSNDQDSILSEISEAIIPETDTPGAKKLEIYKFIKLMVTDMYNSEDQEKFKKSLDKVDQISKLLYGSVFSNCSKEQKVHLLNGLELSTDAEQKWFFNTTKRYAIQAYTTSEYYLTNIAKFEFAPGRYLGCVPLNS